VDQAAPAATTAVQSQPAGLYRTEFLYLASKTEPTEDDHFAAYAEVVQAMAGQRLPAEIPSPEALPHGLDHERRPECHTQRGRATCPSSQ